ncbi:hypothetical protein KUV80_10100 [Fictibacillus nanhaiensis]|uniref:hypothetical protein n=1 Tax=Fictibacillus nanhaiensis TaxID=742169 RepID=UPI001C93C9A8|nr:hypothetical protein [Fictibacillus nanhaiensis]MBY6037009.1 hypothetical protein [Fictibacillus nanhaiensis]
MEHDLIKYVLVIVLLFIVGLIFFIIGLHLAWKEIKRNMKSDSLLGAIITTIVGIHSDPTSLTSICLFIGIVLSIIGFFLLLDFVGFITI